MNGPRITRRLRLRIVASLAVLGIIELIAYFGLTATGTYPEASFREVYATSLCLKSDEFNYGLNPANRQNADVMLARLPHPFFGFVVNPGNNDLAWRRTAVGPTYENELRYAVSLGKDPRPADTYTIGIFGASVAVSFAQYVQQNDRFANMLREKIPGLRDREIVIRNMAIGASRQPSQLAIATQYMELFDMTINLDGYSEQAITMYPNYPIEHPMFGDVFFSQSGPSLYLNLRAAETLCTWISEPGRLPLLRHSNTYYLFWHLASASIKRTIAHWQAAPDVAENLPFTEDQVRALYAAYYERYTRYQSQLLTDNGVHAYFFLQPNQYVPDSKPFSSEERRSALNMADAPETTRRYALLQDKVRDLASRGVQAFDLTGVFASVEDTVYVDSCCHVNELGNQLIADAVVRAIADVENADGFAPVARPSK